MHSKKYQRQGDKNSRKSSASRASLTNHNMFEESIYEKISAMELRSTRHADEIAPGLFLGSRKAFSSSDFDTLTRKFGVVGVVRCLNDLEEDDEFHENVEERLTEFGVPRFLRVPIKDNVEADIHVHFNRTANFIKDVLSSPLPNTSKSDLMEDSTMETSMNFRSESKSPAVLVHCQMGISRSASIVCAYLIKELKFTLEEALLQSKKRRSVVLPNAGFLQALINWEETLYGAPCTFDIWLFHKYAPMFPTASNTLMRTVWDGAIEEVEEMERKAQEEEAARHSIVESEENLSSHPSAASERKKSAQFLGVAEDVEDDERPKSPGKVSSKISFRSTTSGRPMTPTSPTANNRPKSPMSRNPSQRSKNQERPKSPMSRNPSQRSKSQERPKSPSRNPSQHEGTTDQKIPSPEEIFEQKMRQLLGQSQSQCCGCCVT